MRKGLRSALGHGDVAPCEAAASGRHDFAFRCIHYAWLVSVSIHRFASTGRHRSTKRSDDTYAEKRYRIVSGDAQKARAASTTGGPFLFGNAVTGWKLF